MQLRVVVQVRSDEDGAAIGTDGGVQGVGVQVVTDTFRQVLWEINTPESVALII